MFFGGFLLGILLASACGLDLFRGSGARRGGEPGGAPPTDLEALLAGSREERDRLAGELARLETELEAARKRAASSGAGGEARPGGTRAAGAARRETGPAPAE